MSAEGTGFYKRAAQIFAANLMLFGGNRGRLAFPQKLRGFWSLRRRPAAQVPQSGTPACRSRTKSYGHLTHLSDRVKPAIKGLSENLGRPGELDSPPSPRVPPIGIFSAIITTPATDTQPWRTAALANGCAVVCSIPAGSGRRMRPLSLSVRNDENRPVPVPQGAVRAGWMPCVQ